MFPKNEQVSRLKEVATYKNNTEYEKAIENWQSINEATVLSDLIPRFYETFNSRGLKPIFVLADRTSIYGMPVVVAERSILVFPKGIEDVPGFTVGHAFRPDHTLEIFVASDLAPDIKRQFLELEEEPLVEGSSSKESSPKPYWWPKNYPDVDLMDFTDYGNLDGSKSFGSVMSTLFDETNGVSVWATKHEDFPKTWQSAAKEIDIYFSILESKLGPRRIRVRS